MDEVLGDLFEYGTTTLDRVAFQKALDDIAASESAGYDFSLRVLTEHFSRGVELLADHELRPALPAEAFEIVRRQTTDYVAGNMKSPGYRASRALSLALLPLGDPGLREATPQTISALSLDDVQQYYRTVFRPDLTTIVVIGDITADEARATIEKWFGVWQASGPKPDLTLPRVPLNPPSTAVVPDPTQVQASVTLAEQVGLTRFDPDYYSLQLGNYVLGGGFYATRLYRDLRQVTGYVYSVEADFTATKSRAIYTVTYGADPENVSKARDLIVRDLRTMQTENVTPGELHQAKAIVLRQMPLDEPVRAAKRYFQLTADEIRMAFAKWIRPDGFVQVVRGPAAK